MRRELLLCSPWPSWRRDPRTETSGSGRKMGMHTWTKDAVVHPAFVSSTSCINTGLVWEEKS